MGKLKKSVSVILAAVLMLSVMLIAPVTAYATTQNYDLVIGKSYTKTVPEPTTLYGMVLDQTYHVYSFTMTSASNVKVTFTPKGASQHWSLRSTDYNVSTGTQNGGVYGCYLPKDKTYSITVSGAGKYTLRVDTDAPDVISTKSKSCKIGDSKKTVAFTYTGTDGYAKDNLTVGSKNKKVATVSYEITAANKGKFTITPKAAGKTYIMLRMKGSNTIKFTVYVTQSYWFIAKGSTQKAPAPIGISKPKWSSANKKVAVINKKTGKVRAKKGGRVNFTAKKGKVNFRITGVVTDYIVIGKRAYRQLKDIVNNPEKLKIYNVYSGYSKQIYSGQKVPVVMVDYGSTNENGAMIRHKIVAWYDDVYEVHYANNWSVDNIIGRRRIDPSKIK